LTLNTVFDWTTGDGEQEKEERASGGEQQNGWRSDERLNNDRLATQRRGERMRGGLDVGGVSLGGADPQTGCNAYILPADAADARNKINGTNYGCRNIRRCYSQCPPLEPSLP
jgi:hypothetical protein